MWSKRLVGRSRLSNALENARLCVFMQLLHFFWTASHTSGYKCLSFPPQCPLFLIAHLGVVHSPKASDECVMFAPLSFFPKYTRARRHVLCLPLPPSKKLGQFPRSSCSKCVRVCAQAEALRKATRKGTHVSAERDASIPKSEKRQAILLAVRE